jgi:hypothetical protein
MENKQVTKMNITAQDAPPVKEQELTKVKHSPLRTVLKSRGFQGSFPARYPLFRFRFRYHGRVEICIGAGCHGSEMIVVMLDMMIEVQSRGGRGEQPDRIEDLGFEVPFVLP